MSKTKIINLYSGYSEFSNRLDSVDNFVISPEFEIVHPISNLLSFSTVKDLRIKSFFDEDSSTYKAGIEINQDKENWNTCVIKFNKLNSKYLSMLKESTIKVTIFNDTNSFIINFNRSTSDETYSSNVLNTPKFSEIEGIILIDQDLTRYFDVQNFDNTYKVKIEIERADFFEYFSVSNITLTNSYDLCIDASFKFDNDNLSKITRSKNEGVVFRTKGGQTKKLSASISLLNTKEQVQLYKEVVYPNKDVPFFFFLYCEMNETEGFEESENNLTTGGMYVLTDYFNLDSSTYDVYKTDIKLEEFK